MELNFDYIYGQTPVSEEEKEGLLIQTISFRQELDEFEQENIEFAIEWTIKHRFTSKKILTIEFIKEVHRQMFNKVWKWAGTFRKTNKNIGLDKFEINQELKVLLDDCKYWIDHDSYSGDEIAIRFKHRLVSIHPFSNGNGRHSRLCADILISHVFNEKMFSWGGFYLIAPGVSRNKYLDAIHIADAGDIKPLLRFARS